jgi:hypothetical protein
MYQVLHIYFMKKTGFSFFFLLLVAILQAQTNPAITHWIINTNGQTGRHYVQGNPTPIQDNVSANVQSVQYSNDWVYVKATGIPAYITGPFLDGNPSLATAQTGYFKISLNPVPNTGTFTATTPGNIGAFINGVALFDYRDGVAWNTNTNALCGGPGNPPCPGGPAATQSWNRDAIPAERAGFDCSKAHPAMGNYHHHQNPSAFNLDQLVISNVCDLYPADGLYAIDSSVHAPLLGFAYDGFPIYGAYAFKNTDGSGGVTRMKSGYRLRNIAQRTHHASGTDVPDGPPVSTTYPLGYFREDYEFVAGNSADVLDEHNGRFCVTPEYPQGIYCYFTTVDANWNSAYPYAVGPTFYGVKTASKVQNITEPVSSYTPVSATSDVAKGLKISIFPNPATDFIGVQTSGILHEAVSLRLYELNGRLVQQVQIQPGSTLAYFDCRTLYPGVYLVALEQPDGARLLKKVVVESSDE